MHVNPNGDHVDHRKRDHLARAGVEAAALDMWEPLINSVRAPWPDADDTIVFARYHIMSQLGEAADTVRKRETRDLRAVGDDTLVASKQLWPYARENLPRRHRARFAALRDADLETARAWAIKEDLRWLWTYRHPTWGRRHWQAWRVWATHSQLPTVIDTAHMLQRHLTGILAFFRHRITSAGCESLNSRIQAIRVAARGFRNREHFKTAVFFHGGGLDRYPATHSIPG